MKQIPLDSKILSVSHNDLDGAVSQIVLGNVYKNITYINQSFYKIDSCLESINYDQYDYVILTDIAPSTDKLLDISDKIVLLDHHGSASTYANGKKNRFVVEGICGAKLTKRFVEKMYDIKLTHLDDLVFLTNDYDLWIHEDSRSKQINDLMFYKYRPRKFREGFMDGRTTFTDEEKEYLEERRLKFEEIYQALNVFEFDKIKGCIVQEREFINEIAERLMDEEDYRFIVIRNPSHGRVSIRHNLDDVDVGEILKELQWGGGHAQSAGMFSDSTKEFKERINIIEQKVYDISEDARTWLNYYTSVYLLWLGVRFVN